MGEKPIVFFDGVCNFCNYWVNFAIRRDKKKKLFFAPLQGKTALELLHEQRTVSSLPDSVILLENQKIYTESSASLRICKHLGGGWKLFYSFIIIPKFIRDFFYRIIARNRYRLFGKKDQCMIPSANVRERFLN